MATIMNFSSGDDRLRRDRKYRAFWAVFLMASVMTFWNKLGGTEYVELMIFVFGLYMAGNVGEHWTKNKANAEVNHVESD